MKKIRLRTFVILSLVFHVVLITALVLIFLPQRTIIKSSLYPISFGTLPQNKVVNDAKDNSFNLIPLGVSKRAHTPKSNQPEKKETPQANDNEKPIRKINHQEEKTSVKKSIKNKISVSRDSSPKEAETAIRNLGFRETDKQTNNAGTRPLSGNADEEVNSQMTTQLRGKENMNLKRDSGTDSLSRNIELAFPDYKVNPKPRYPMLARRKGYEGTILLRVLVLESGGVGKVELEKSSGYEILDESALKAVKEWVFIPGKNNGQPTPSWVTVPIKFQLNSG